MGYGWGVHNPQCLPSHLPNNGKAVESRHIPILILFDVFHDDVDACTTVAVVLMPTVPTLEPLLVLVCSLGVFAHRTPLTSEPRKQRIEHSEAAPVETALSINTIMSVKRGVEAGRLPSRSERRQP